jgi:dienelactone hydrolase
MQGLDDKVVPPSQAEAIVEALAANGIPHAYIAFEGEGHGFRGASAIRRSIEAELSFLGQVFGFDPADELERVAIPGLDDWLERHAGARPGSARPTANASSG